MEDVGMSRGETVVEAHEGINGDEKLGVGRMLWANSAVERWEAQLFCRIEV